MALRPRIYYNAEQKAEMWDRWQRGASLTSIGNDTTQKAELKVIRTNAKIAPKQTPKLTVSTAGTAISGHPITALLVLGNSEK